MSRSWNKQKPNYYGCVKKAVKSGCKKFSRADARMKIALILADPEIAEEITFDRYQDYDDRWNYD